MPTITFEKIEISFDDGQSIKIKIQLAEISTEQHESLITLFNGLKVLENPPREEKKDPGDFLSNNKNYNPEWERIKDTLFKKVNEIYKLPSLLKLTYITTYQLLIDKKVAKGEELDLTPIATVYKERDFEAINFDDISSTSIRSGKYFRKDLELFAKAYSSIYGEEITSQTLKASCINTYLSFCFTDSYSVTFGTLLGNREFDILDFVEKDVLKTALKMAIEDIEKDSNFDVPLIKILSSEMLTDTLDFIIDDEVSSFGFRKQIKDPNKVREHLLKNIHINAPYCQIAGITLYKRGHIKEAIASFQKSYSISSYSTAPGHKINYFSDYAIAVIYLEQGDIKNSMKVLELASNNIKTIIKGFQLESEATSSSNVRNYDMKEIDKLKYLQVLIICSRGFAHLENNNIKQAQEDFEQLVNFQKRAEIDYINPYQIDLSLMFRIDHTYEKKLQFRNQEYFNPHIGLCMIHMRQSEWDKALVEINQALKLDGKCARSFMFRGDIFRQLGEYDQARQDYQQASIIATYIIDKKEISQRISALSSYERDTRIESLIAEFSRLQSQQNKIGIQERNKIVREVTRQQNDQQIPNNIKENIEFLIKREISRFYIENVNLSPGQSVVIENELRNLEQNKAYNSLKLQEIKISIELCYALLSEQREEIEQIQHRLQIDPDSRRQRERILANPVLKVYYEQCYKDFNKSLIAAMAIGSGLVKIEDDVKDNIINVVSAIGSNLPVASIFVTMLQNLASAINGSHKSEMIGHICDLVHDANEAGLLSEKFARTITLEKKDQIISGVAAPEEGILGNFISAVKETWRSLNNGESNPQKIMAVADVAKVYEQVMLNKIDQNRDTLPQLIVFVTGRQQQNIIQYCPAPI